MSTEPERVVVRDPLLVATVKGGDLSVLVHDNFKMFDPITLGVVLADMYHSIVTAVNTDVDPELIRVLVMESFSKSLMTRRGKYNPTVHANHTIVDLILPEPKKLDENLDAEPSVNRHMH